MACAGAKLLSFRKAPGNSLPSHKRAVMPVSCCDVVEVVEKAEMRAAGGGLFSDPRA